MPRVEIPKPIEQSQSNAPTPLILSLKSPQFEIRPERILQDAPMEAFVDKRLSNKLCPYTGGLDKLKLDYET